MNPQYKEFKYCELKEVLYYYANLGVKRKRKERGRDAIIKTSECPMKTDKVDKITQESLQQIPIYICVCVCDLQGEKNTHSD